MLIGLKTQQLNLHFTKKEQEGSSKDSQNNIQKKLSIKSSNRWCLTTKKTFKEHTPSRSHLQRKLKRKNESWQQPQKTDSLGTDLQNDLIHHDQRVLQKVIIVFKYFPLTSCRLVLASLQWLSSNLQSISQMQERLLKYFPQYSL